MSNAKLLLSGNEAIARGAIDAGCTFYAGYPITPQNELIAYMASHMQKSGGVFIQAEAEVSAINMVFGAAAAGVRAMTSSSSPGISLKQEGISYIAGANLPAVIVNIMRAGPGLGNIFAAQSDYFQATRGGGHGDYHCIVLAPSCVPEAYDLTQKAFELADTYRMPVIILGDGRLGQMMEPVQVASPQARKPASKNKPWALTGCRGRKPNIVKSFHMKQPDLESSNKAQQEKYRLIKEKESLADKYLVEDADIILVAYGTMARIAKPCVNSLRKRRIKAGLIRPITLWPFPEDIFRQLAVSRKPLAFLVVEMSYGQMVEDVRLSVAGSSKVEFLGKAGGGIPTEEEIIKSASRLYEKNI